MQPVEVRILGPLEVSDHGRLLKLGSKKQRALLALLVLNAGKLVSRDRLIDDLWEGKPPPAAEATLRSHISRLRAQLGERIESRPPGYALVLAPDELDAARCDRALAAAREALARGSAHAAAEQLRGALALWRGQPLADVAYATFARPEVARLEELRLALREERIEADLALGRHAEVVGELDALVAEHPLRERLRGQLMLALYRCGRQAEALDAYRQARELLSDELGLEPSTELRELQRAILAHEPSLSTAVSSGGDDARSAAPSSFVGRRDELSLLLSALDGTLTGSGRVLLVGGEPGIGKSRLIEQLVDVARARGTTVLTGRCWEAGGAPAYWPWVQALRLHVRSTDRDRLRAELADGAADLAQLLPELHELYDELPAPPAGDPEGARFRLFDAASSFLQRISEDAPLAIALDDLHAADEPSLLLLRFLAGSLDASRVLIVGAYRDADPSPPEPLLEALADLRRRPANRLVRLSGFDLDEVTTFLASAGPDRAASLATRLHEVTEGNPLFLGEIVRLLATERALDQLATGTDLQRLVPEEVRDVIRRRLRHLSENCRIVLVVAAVLGREFDLAALEQVCDVSGEQLLDVLDEAVRERIVTDSPGQTGSMRFAHALIRDTLYEDLNAGRRTQLHRRVGDALEQLHADNLDPHLAELAHHYHESARPGLADKAFSYAQRAAQRSLSLLAYEEAARLFEITLDIANTGGSRSDAQRLDLLLDLGDAYARGGDTPRSKRRYLEAARLAEALHAPERLAQAALGYGGRIAWDVSRDDEHLVPLLEQAIAAVGKKDSALRIRLLARLAGGPLRDSRADPNRRTALGTEALEAARRIGDPLTLAYALLGYIGSHHSPEFTPRQAELAAELIDAAQSAGDLERVIDGYELRFQSHIELGDLDRALSDLDQAARIAGELRQPAQYWLVGVHQTLLALLQGRLDEAEGLLEQTRLLGERAQSWNAEVTHGLQLYLLRREQGRLDEVLEHVRSWAAANPSYPVWRCALTDALVRTDQLEEARKELAALAEERFAAIPFDEEWLVSCCLLAEAAVTLAEGHHAAVLRELLLPYADRVAISYPEISLGPVAYHLGLLAAMLHLSKEAGRHFEQAMLLAEQLHASPSIERVRAARARMDPS